MTKQKQQIPLNSPLLPIISPVAMCLCSSSHREEESIFLHFESGLALWNAVCRRMGPNCDVLPALSHSSRGHAYLRSSLGVPPGCHGKKLHLASRSWVSHLFPQKTQACERAQSRPANRVQMVERAPPRPEPPSWTLPKLQIHRTMSQLNGNRFNPLGLGCFVTQG